MAKFSTAFGIDFTNFSILNVLTGYPMVTHETVFGFRATKASMVANVSGENFVWEPFSDVPLLGTMKGLSLSGGLLTSVSFTGLNLDYLSFRSTLIGGGPDAALAMLLKGQDTIEGSGFADHLLGFKGSDTIRGRAGLDVIDGGDMGDYLYGDGGDDRLYGRDGGDLLYGGEGRDRLFGGAEGDFMDAGTGMDEVDGGGGADVLRYEGRSESVKVTLDGATTVTVIVGGVAEDTVVNVEGVSGGSGHDRLTGDDSTNYLSGGGGEDLLHGRGAKDYLIGGFGDDGLKGGRGDDTLSGSQGYDILNGGDGADTFAFDMVPGAGDHDRIMDFKIGLDKVSLSKTAFTALGSIYSPSGPLNPDYFAYDQAGDSNDYVVYDRSSGSLFYDQDGSGNAYAKTLLATFKKAPLLDAGDIVTT